MTGKAVATHAAKGIVAVGLLTLGLAACSTVPNVALGETESQLVAQLGPPASVAADGDARVLTYRRPQTATLPAMGPTPWDAPFTPYVSPAPPGSESLPAEIVVTGVCTLQYRLVDGRVVSSQHSGNGC